MASGPADVEAGGMTTFSWTVSNLGDGDATGTWADSVWLSSDAVWDPNDRLLGEVTRNTTLAAGDSYDGNLTSPAIPSVDGEHKAIVRNDARPQVAEPVSTHTTIGRIHRTHAYVTYIAPDSTPSFTSSSTDLSLVNLYAT